MANNEYTISKIELPNGDICNIKDTTYNFNTAYNATTNKAATMADIKTDNIKPIKSASFVTGKYGQDGSGTHYYETLGQITPNEFEKIWLVRYIISIEVAGDSLYTYRSDVSFYGVRNTYAAYKIFNSYYSRYPIYQHAFLEGNNISYPHEFGYRLASSYGDTTLIKSIQIDVIETRNCTITFFNAPKAYTSDTPSNYTWRAFNATLNGLQETGDSDTLTRLSAGNNTIKTSTTMRLAGASLFGFDRDNRAQTISLYNNGYTSTTTSINTARVYNSAGFDWAKGLFYNTAGNYATNTDIYPVIDQSIHAIDFRYTDNCVNSSALTTLGLERYKAVYLRGTIEADGLFYLAPLTVSYNNQNYKRAWTQDIPTSADGYVYWFLGFPYYNSSYAGGYQLNFYLENKLYAYYDGKFQEYIPTISITDKTSGTLPITRGGTGAITDSSARTNLGLGNVSNNSNLNNVAGAKGDIIYWSATNTPAHLTNTSSTTKQFLSITSQVPSWSSVSKSDVGLGNVENTALSTWAGTNKITTLGTITTGTWQGTAIAASYIGNHSTDKLTSGTLPVERGGTGQTSIANIQAGKDGDGNTISSTYLKLSGGDLTGNLGIITGDTDKFLNFWYNTNKIAGASWRLGVLGSGGDDTNYFIIQSGTSGVSATTWNDTIRIGQNTYDVAFGGNIYPLTNNTKTLGTSSYKWSNVYATTFTGNLTGNVTGNVTGSSGSCTGNAATATKATQDANGNTISSTYLKLSGGTLTGSLTIAGVDLVLGTSSSSSNDSSDLVWQYGNGQEKIRIWSPDSPTAKTGPYFRIFNASGTSLYSGVLPLGDGTGASGTWGISISGNAATATKATQDGSGNTITSKYVTVDTDQLSITGQKRFTKAVQCYRYTTNNNLPAITMDKPGSHCIGIGADGTNSRIHFGPCIGLDGSAWVDTSTFNDNEWYFQGNITCTNNIKTAAGCRIGESGGPLYLGNSGNQSWVYLQDMCSQSGSDKWKILANGTANFAGTVTVNTLSLSNALSVSNGGTGATNATDARTNLQVPQVSPGTNDVQIAFFSFKGRDGNWYDLIIYNGASYKIGLNKHGVGLVWRF